MTDFVDETIGAYSYVAWLEDESLVVQYDDNTGNGGGTVYSSRLFWLRPGSGNLQAIALPSDSANCVNRGYEEPTRLPNGKLGFMLRCKYDKEVFLDKFYMMSYDLKTQTATPLLSYPLPFQNSRLGAFSWNPSMSRAINDDRGGLSEQLYWLMPDHWEPLRTGFSRATYPSWSEDGTEIAFWGAPEQGLSGLAKGAAVFNLYLMKPDGSGMRPAVNGFRYPYNIAWSPDSKWLAFAATSADDNQEGVWLVDVTQGKLYLIARGHFLRIAWAPQSSKLAAILLKNDEHTQSQLVLLDLASLLQSP